MAKLSPIKVELHATIEPGSSVLLTIDHDVSADELQTIRDRIKERFPGVEFTFVRASGIAVMPPTARQAIKEGL